MPFWKPRERPLTIGELKEEGRNIAFVCDRCDSITLMTPNQTKLGHGVEVSTLEHFLACPECRYVNDIANGSHLLRIKAEGRGKA